MNNKIAEFLGWYFGDGSLSIKNNRYQFSITGDLKEEELFYQETIIPLFNEIFNHLLKKEIKLKKYKSVGVCGLYVFNKKFTQHIIKKYKLKPGKAQFKK